MEEDILNYSPTVMFRGTPCISCVRVISFPKVIKSKFLRIKLLKTIILRSLIVEPLKSKSLECLKKWILNFQTYYYLAENGSSTSKPINYLAEKVEESNLRNSFILEF